MNFGQRLQELRKQKCLTQEELASILYISRTAVSKWESGRGFPSIELLLALSSYFNVTINDLLSEDNFDISSEKEDNQNKSSIRELVFGLLDCSLVLFLVLPLFGQQVNDIFIQVSLIALTNNEWNIKTNFIILVIISVIFGLLTLLMHYKYHIKWSKLKKIISLSISLFSVMIFMASFQLYAAFLSLINLVIKGSMVIKLE